MVEEPEIYLHPRSQEVIVDPFNTAANDWHKQVIFTAHGNVLLPFISDVGEGTKRGSHPRANPENFRLVTFAQKEDDTEIMDYDLERTSERFGTTSRSCGDRHHLFRSPVSAIAGQYLNVKDVESSERLARTTTRQ